MENIRFGRPDASDDDVRSAARAAAADELLPDCRKDMTPCGRTRCMLSGGQNNACTAARYWDAPVLLLDEATSALDAESERLVQEAVDAAANRKHWSLRIAWRLSRKLIALWLWTKVKSRALERTSILWRKGLYARLAKLQFTDGVAAE